jgi:iron complex transport system substrate-binding protein
MPLGDIAQCLVCTLCPDALASVVSEIDDSDGHEWRKTSIGGIAQLPNTGGGAKSGVDVEPQSAIVVGADVMLDAGIPRDGLCDELDSLQNHGEIPCVFLDTSFGNLSRAFRLLGELLNRQQRAEELASFVESAMARVEALRRRIDNPCSIFYAPRRLGLEVKSSVSVQIDAISYIGARPVVAPYDFTTRSVDFGKLNSANPNLIVFDDTSSLASLIVREGTAWDVWRNVKAVSDRRFAVSPALFYSWFGSLVHVQSIGILWLASIVWPSQCNYDVRTLAADFYRLFYGYESDEGEIEKLIGTYRKGGYLVEC